MTELEGDLLYLSAELHVSPVDGLRIPYGIRKRLCNEHHDLHLLRMAERERSAQAARQAR